MSKRSVALHYEILNAERKAILPRLAAFRTDGYLAGGTALALQLGHRYSYDFDIFCYREISSALLRKCRQVFTIQEVLVNNANQEFTFLTKQNVKITFFYHEAMFPGKLLPISSSLGMLSVLNIAAAKAFTLNYRGQYRDYVDLYVIMRSRHISLARIIQQAKKVYDTLFSEKLFLGQLVYFQDIDQSDIRNIQWVKKPVPAATIMSYLQRQTKQYIQKIIIR